MPYGPAPTTAKESFLELVFMAYSSILREYRFQPPAELGGALRSVIPSAQLARTLPQLRRHRTLLREFPALCAARKGAVLRRWPRRSARPANWRRPSAKMGSRRQSAD